MKRRKSGFQSQSSIKFDRQEAIDCVGWRGCAGVSADRPEIEGGSSGMVAESPAGPQCLDLISCFALFRPWLILYIRTHIFATENDSVYKTLHRGLL